MLKYTILVIFFYVVSIKNGLSLTCYSSDLKNLLTSKYISHVEHSLKDCNEYVNDIRRMLNSSEGQLSPNITMHCFSALIADDDSSDVVIKGCFPKSGCEIMKDHLRNIVKRGNAYVQCDECAEDGCNSAALKKNVITNSVTLMLAVIVLAIGRC